MNGQTRQRKGKVTASPRAKAKAKAKAGENIQEMGNRNQDQAGSPNEDGQRTLGDFGLKRQRVEFVGDLSKRRTILRLPDWIEQLVSDESEEPTGIHEKFDQQRERCFSPLDVEMIDQLLTLEVLSPRAQLMM